MNAGIPISISAQICLRIRQKEAKPWPPAKRRRSSSTAA